MTNENHKSIDAVMVIRFAIVASMFVAGALLYSRLPEVIPTHWGISGEPDSWSSKSWGTWLMPGMALLFLIFFPLLPKLDPKRENYEHFKKSWGVIQTALVAFLAYMYAITMYVTFYPQYNGLVGRFVMFGIGIMFIALGNVMGKVRQNYFVGLKTPWTLNDPEVWQKSQRFAGWLFVVSGLLFAIEAFVWIWFIPVFIAVIVAMIFAPIIYSYLLAQKRKG